ncbi:MAG: prepilin-type N-terminal cleavage/methylation domain-containing protein [Deltaproteobacteria bacterium]|nr:prepilin-type N-terminal cleavage/methylation domain-containing protein [Deltaproteobacteria bacterium]
MTGSVAGGTEPAGFTLIELMVVVSLLALVGLLSLPLMMNQGDSAERRSLRQVAGVVKQLYNEAVLTRDEYLLTFDFDRNSLRAYRLRSKGELNEKERFGKEVTLSPLHLRQVDVEGRGSFRRGRVSVRIFPLGWMEQTRVVLVSEDGKLIQLTFSPLTGTTKIEDVHQTLQ